MSARSARSWAMISAAGDASAASANTTAPLRRVSDATSGVKPTPPARGPPVGPKRLSGKLLPSP